MHDCIKDYGDLVHDNEILSYQVDIANNVLTMVTKFYDWEDTTIVFSGFLAHKFERVMSGPNIIFDLHQISIQKFVDENREQLTHDLPYGFPIGLVKTCDELINVLEARDYKVYQIDSTLGLYGYVIAKDISITVVDKRE